MASTAANAMEARQRQARHKVGIAKVMIARAVLWTRSSLLRLLWSRLNVVARWRDNGKRGSGRGTWRRGGPCRARSAVAVLFVADGGKISGGKCGAKGGRRGAQWRDGCVSALRSVATLFVAALAVVALEYDGAMAVVRRFRGGKSGDRRFRPGRSIMLPTLLRK